MEPRRNSVRQIRLPLKLNAGLTTWKVRSTEILREYYPIKLIRKRSGRVTLSQLFTEETRVMQLTSFWILKYLIRDPTGNLIFVTCSQVLKERWQSLLK